MIRLYRAPFSTNVERVALALALKGLAVESVVIDYADRSRVIAVSGQGLVPVIEEDGAVVADSLAILRHLDARHPDPPLFPADPARRAELGVFLEWFDAVWKRPPNDIEAELEQAAPDHDRIAALAEQMDRWLDAFEALLSGRDHLFGDELTAADLVAFPFLKYAAARDPADDERFHRILDEHQSVDRRPNLAAWIARMNALPRV